MLILLNKLITITVPQYFKQYVDKNIDLTETNAICCPFHKEKTPSFRYNPSTGMFRCFGACKTGGDVVVLHRLNYRLKDNITAEESLCKLLGIVPMKLRDLNVLETHVIIDDDSLRLDRIYNLCLMHANTIERWIEMDYVMSFYPPDIIRLESLLLKWRVRYD